MPAATTARSTGSPGRDALASWLGWGGLGLVALLGAASSGISGFFGLSGFYAFVVAVIALIRGRVTWAHLRTRAAGATALGAAVALTIVGGATASPIDNRTTAAPPSSSTQTQAPTPSATPTPTPTATPTPTPTPTATPTPTPTPTAAKSAVAPATAAAKGTALAAAATLTGKGRAPKTGYSREAFGQAWFDSDRNGCDTRNDILRRDLKSRSMKNSCKVLAGTLKPDPYTAKQVRFVYGGTSEVDIDHVVALSDAWQKGAARWADGKRVAFANDPLNLLAVAAGANRAKGDGDAATWLPPNKSFRCPYVARQVAVKGKYGVWVTAAERDAMVRVLRTCPAQKLPVSKDVPLGGGTIVATPSTPKPTPPAPRKPSTRLDPRFDTCRAANAAGYGPYYEGKDAEYGWYQDRDHDGMVCE